jgi:8-oxo-dGTP pyrophosphatase MutT (NUDIX family)
MNRVDKAFAYITSGSRLLVFEHADFPEVGLQVPAGTIHDGELPEHAVLREAHEETGLQDLSTPTLLGVSEFDARPFGKDEIHRRHFFHMRAEGELRERWRHYECDASDGSPPIAFDLYWLEFAEAAERLGVDHGILIPLLGIEGDDMSRRK